MTKLDKFKPIIDKNSVFEVSLLETLEESNNAITVLETKTNYKSLVGLISFPSVEEPVTMTIIKNDFDSDPDFVVEDTTAFSLTIDSVFTAGKTVYPTAVYDSVGGEGRVVKQDASSFLFTFASAGVVDLPIEIKVYN